MLINTIIAVTVFVLVAWFFNWKRKKLIKQLADRSFRAIDLILKSCGVSIEGEELKKKWCF